MEIIGILIAVVIIVAFIKFLGLLLHAGIWVIALPFKIIFAVIGTIIMVAILIPLGILGAIASIVVIPMTLIVPLTPFLLIGLGLWLLIRKNS
ncbi:MAG: hypothetical protein JW956_02005 [Calditrichaceae bacterium]|nr:hypothetical protein [Calditrichaceae bacterium]